MRPTAQANGVAIGTLDAWDTTGLLEADDATVLGTAGEAADAAEVGVTLTFLDVRGVFAVWMDEATTEEAMKGD